MPIPIIRLILPPVAELLVLQEEIKHKILAFEGESKGEARSVVVSALGDPTIPPPERHIDRLLDEATAIIFAGTETSSRALSVGMFHLLNDKAHLAKLRNELKSLPMKPDNDYSMSQLEPLPYLVGPRFPPVLNSQVRLKTGIHRREWFTRVCASPLAL